VAEHDGLTFAPVLVENLNAVLGYNLAHATLSLVVVVVLLGLIRIFIALPKAIGRQVRYRRVQGFAELPLAHVYF
jgi:hypothetical protein